MRAFESRNQKLLPFPAFVRRVINSLLVAGSILFTALGIGVLGYHFIAGLPWIDAVLNASMILTGMGPVDTLHTVGAKLFASAYAIFSGVIFITIMALVLAPIFHRIIHAFHVEGEPSTKGK